MQVTCLERPLALEAGASGRVVAISCDRRNRRANLVKGMSRAMEKPDTIEKAQSTYASFVNWFKWGTIIVAILTAIVVMIIA